jgi:hypothetical protein
VDSGTINPSFSAANTAVTKVGRRSNPACGKMVRLWTDRIRLQDLMMGYAAGKWFSSSSPGFAKKQDGRLPTSMMLTASDRDQGEPSRHRATIVVGLVRATHGRMPGVKPGKETIWPAPPSVIHYGGLGGWVHQMLGESLVRDEGNTSGMSTGAGFAKTRQNEGDQIT